MNSKDAANADRFIIERIRQGDIEAFAILLDRYRAWVFAIVRRHVPAGEADELAHDIFVEAYKALPGYRGDSEFRHWLAGIAVRQCCSFWRRAGRRPAAADPGEYGDAQAWLDWAARAEAQDRYDRDLAQRGAREILEYALGRLNAEDRTLLTLMHLEERPVKDVARLMQWSTVNVKVRAHRARRRLRQVLDSLRKRGAV